jgi:hypothetical protein
MGVGLGVETTEFLVFLLGGEVLTVLKLWVA